MELRENDDIFFLFSLLHSFVAVMVCESCCLCALAAYFCNRDFNESQKLLRCLISNGKEIGDKEPYYSTNISIFSFIWAGLAALH